MVLIFKALRFIYYPLYFTSFFTKRDSKIWLFGSHQNRYCENTKYLYQYISKNQPSIKAIWISGNKKIIEELKEKGFKAYLRWSLKGIYYCLKGNYYFYNVYSDDINFYTSGNAKLINLWHGVPLKKIEFDIVNGPLNRIFNSRYSFVYRFFKPYLFRNPDYVISTSDVTKNIFSSAFRLEKSKCISLGTPRTDIFFEEKLNHNSLDLLKDINTKTYKIILYMPTWRSLSKNFLTKAIPDFSLLNDSLIESQNIMIIKLHPNTELFHQNYSNIIFIDPMIDVYEFISECDYLITDYSSIYFDFLLLDKEIIFYPFDYKDYLSKDRNLYFSYQEYTPGLKVYNFDDLIKVLYNINNLNHKSKRDDLKNIIWKYQDGKASERIVDFFKELN